VKSWFSVKTAYVRWVEKTNDEYSSHLLSPSHRSSLVSYTVARVHPRGWRDTSRNRSKSCVCITCLCTKVVVSHMNFIFNFRISLDGKILFVFQIHEKKNYVYDVVDLKIKHTCYYYTARLVLWVLKQLYLRFCTSIEHIQYTDCRSTHDYFGRRVYIYFLYFKYFWFLNSIQS